MMKWRKRPQAQEDVIREALAVAVDPVKEAMRAMADGITRLTLRIESLCESVDGLAASTAESKQELTQIAKRLDELAEERD